MVKPKAGPLPLVAKTFRAFAPDQMLLLLPPSLDDWLPEGHLARFVAELVDEVLDLSPSPSPASKYPHALVAVEATFTTHTMTWRPFTLTYGPNHPETATPACYPAFSPTQILAAPALPQPTISHLNNVTS